MKLTDYSRFRLMQTARLWEVDRDYFEPVYNYLVHGYDPGSFWSAVLANDFFSAMRSSHPANQVSALKKAVGWIEDTLPESAYGSWSRVTDWTKLSQEARRQRLEDQGLIYTEHQEVELALRGADLKEPYWP